MKFGLSRKKRESSVRGESAEDYPRPGVPEGEKQPKFTSGAGIFSSVKKGFAHLLGHNADRYARGDIEYLYRLVAFLNSMDNRRNLHKSWDGHRR